MYQEQVDPYEVRTMTAEVWIALGGLIVTTILALGGVMAYLLRQIDEMERRVLGHITEVYARQVDLARLQEQVSAANGKLDRLLDKVESL